MKAIEPKNKTKQLIAVFSMLLFLFISGKSVLGQDIMSLQPNPNPSLFSVLPNKTAAEIVKSMPIPFEQTMLISYSFPKTMKVEFTVYDKLGNVIKNFVNETKSAGSYTIDISSANLKLGIYYYRLTVGDDTEVKKIILID